MAKEEHITKITVYLSDKINEPLDWVKYKSKKTKTELVREALRQYLPGQLKKYPGFEGSK
jgi:metal-responsive CopG/Arc/MetJ family transcriptional regulator